MKISIIGAGPAGCISALHSKGHDVTLYEEHKKQPVQCAGLISISGLDRLRIKPDFLNKISGARIYSPSKNLLEIKAKKDKVYVVDRQKFDEDLLNSAVDVSEMGENYMQFIIPGIIAMSVLFTSIFSGIHIIWDKQFGFLKETLVAPVSRTEIMLGQTLGGATTAILQGMIILVLSIPLGLQISLYGFIVAIGFMALIGLAFTAFGIAIASRMSDMHGFHLVMNFVIFPIFGLSGALFPIEGLPGWLKTVTLLDPLTYGVEGLRYGLLGASQISPGLSFAVLGGFTVGMILIGAYLFRKTEV